MKQRHYTAPGIACKGRCGVSSSFVFLSYKRSPKTTPVAERLFERCDAQLSGRGFETFFDRQYIEAGVDWLKSIEGCLAKTTHFLALISIDYWRSDECRREFGIALDRYETTGSPRLLLVLADKLEPNDLPMDKLRVKAELQADPEAAPSIARIAKLGQINFLGPYDAAGRLVRLKYESEFLLDDQLAQLVEDIKALPGTT